MPDNLSDGIWPPYEAFYIEGMLFCTTAALRAADDVHAALERGSQFASSTSEWQESARAVLDGVQTLALQAAALSRYLWPARAKELHLARAARIRSGLGVSDDSCLKNRELRNALEHFDERLDEFCRTLAAGVILPTYVGPLGSEPEVPTHLFRAYYTDVGVFEVFGERFEMTPILEEVEVLHENLLEAANDGNRIPYDRAEQAPGT
jgi:hypothetical protein